MIVKEAKEALDDFIKALNECDENAEFVLNIYDNSGAYYRGDFDDWTLEVSPERISLSIE